MDLNIESRLLHKHREWAQQEISLSEKAGREEQFFKELELELEKDWREVEKDNDLGIVLAQWWDGSYYVLKDERLDSMTVALRARSKFGLPGPIIKSSDVKTEAPVMPGVFMGQSWSMIPTSTYIGAPSAILPAESEDDGKAPISSHSDACPTMEPRSPLTERAPLLPRNSSSSDEEASTAIAALMRGCPCS